MLCPNCRNQVEDGQRFCVKCGAEIDATKPIQAPTATMPLPTPNEPKISETPGAQTAPLGSATNTASSTAPAQQSAGPKKSLIIGIVVAAVAIIAIIIAIIMPFGNQDETVSNTLIEAEGTQTSANATPTFQSSCFKIFLPDELAAVINFTETNNTVTMTYDPTDTTIAILFPKGEKLAGEMAYRSYTLGNVYIDGHYEEAEIDFPYVGTNNQLVHWTSKEPCELAIQKLLGISCEDLIDYIYISTGSEYVPANPGMANDPRTTSSNTSASSQNVLTEGSYATPQEPFWGIWVGASKDEQEMIALAEKLKADGLGIAVVVNTADWSNLNSEPWWVVSLGHYESEAIAKSNLSAVQKNGYPKAYVKYSGEKL